jgi:hypothetical protein
MDDETSNFRRPSPQVLRRGRTPDIIDQATRDLAALGHKPMPVLAAVREKCLDCSSGNRAEVRDCLVRNWALWPFRLGGNPWKPERSEAQRAASLKALATSKNSPRLGASGAAGAAGGVVGSAGPVAASGAIKGAAGISLPAGGRP